MPQSACVLLLVALCLAGLAATSANEGDGTAYSGTGQKDATGQNSCGFGQLDDYFEEFYAALPSQVFSRESDCGRCIKVRGIEGDAPGGWVKAMVVDECASCQGDGDVDLSTSALSAATGYSWDRKRIEWEWTSCVSSDEESDSSADDGGSDEQDSQEDNGDEGSDDGNDGNNDNGDNNNGNDEDSKNNDTNDDGEDSNGDGGDDSREEERRRRRRDREERRKERKRKRHHKKHHHHHGDDRRRRSSRRLMLH